MEVAKKEKLQMPSRVLKVSIGENSYDVKLPNNGERIDIQSLKLRMTGSKHADMLYGDEEAMDAYILTSAIATFTILIPELSKNLASPLPSLDRYNPITRNVISAYEKYYEWNKSWKEFINQEADEKK
jgi:hypothetical protein